MVDLNTYKRVFLIGAGGIGMSALARYFRGKGKTVAGYDRNETALTRELCEEGIEVFYKPVTENLPVEFLKKENLETSLVVFTPAVPPGNLLMRFFSENGYKMYKRSDILAAVFNRGKGIAIAGTHGKTTVSAMAAHLLNQLPEGCNAFLGGISCNYGTNLLVSEKSPYIVAEADEFDRSFLKLSPFAAVITSVDPDHLDIYKNYNDLKTAFENFVEKVDEKGVILLRKDVAKKLSLPSGRKTHVYSLDSEADFYASKIRIAGNGTYYFNLHTPSGVIEDLLTGVPGLLNVENFVAAAAVALICGVSTGGVRKGMAGFTGVRRRFEVRVNEKGLVYIDDYAHHPEEIKACISSVREMFPGKEITGVFQPHLYSRTSDFAEEFAASLDLLDRLILTDIYPAREEPVEGVDSRLILEKVSIGKKQLCSYSELPGIIRKTQTDVLLTMGAGDIGDLTEHFESIIKEKIKNK